MYIQKEKLAYRRIYNMAFLLQVLLLYWNYYSSHLCVMAIELIEKYQKEW